VQIALLRACQCGRETWEAHKQRSSAKTDSSIYVLEWLFAPEPSGGRRPAPASVGAPPPTRLKVKGADKYLYRAVDSTGQAIDFLLTAKRDTAAAKRFLRKAIDTASNYGLCFALWKFSAPRLYGLFTDFELIFVPWWCHPP
jgi:hypothetical protein